jgi:hypothetical protein
MGLVDLAESFFSIKHIRNKKIKVKLSHYSLHRPLGFQEVEAPRFIDNRHMKVVRLSALPTGRLYPPRKYSWYSFLLDAELTPGS